MRMLCKRVLLIAVIVPGAGASWAREPIIYERFESLDDWEDLEFRDIDRPTSYSVESEDDTSLLHIESDDGGSGIIHTETFNVYDYPS